MLDVFPRNSNRRTQDIVKVLPYDTLGINSSSGRTKRQTARYDDILPCYFISPG